MFKGNSKANCHIKLVSDLLTVLDSRPEDFTAYDFPIKVCLAAIDIKLTKSGDVNTTYIKMFNKKFREDAAKYAFDKFLSSVSFP